MPLHHEIYTILYQTRDAKAAAELIFAHRKRGTTDDDAQEDRQSQLFSQVSGLFVADNNNRRKEYRHELMALWTEIEETHPEDAGRLFKLLGASLKEQHDAHQKSDFALSDPELHVRFKALRPCEEYFYEFRALGATVHANHRKIKVEKRNTRLKNVLRLQRARIMSVWNTLTTKRVPADVRAAADRIRADLEKRNDPKLSKDQKTRLHKQEDLNHLIVDCYTIIRWATARRPEEILNLDKDYTWSPVEGSPYLMQCKLAKKSIGLDDQKPHTFPVLLDSARIMQLLDFVRHEPTARERMGGGRKTLAQKFAKKDSTVNKLVNKRLKTLFAMIHEEPIQRLYARIRGIYFHMAWGQREQNGFMGEGEDWTFDMFALEALGHDSFDTNEHYQDIELV